MVFCMRSLGIAGRFDCVSVGRTPGKRGDYCRNIQR